MKLLNSIFGVVIHAQPMQEDVVYKRWEYCTMVATQTIENRMLVVSMLKSNSDPEGRTLGKIQLGTAIAQLGAEGWEMCGFYTVNLADGTGQQFYFKRPLD